MPQSLDNKSPRIIRMAHPLAFAAFLRHVGAPVDRHFQRQRLPAHCEDPNYFVPLHKVWAFFDAAAQSEDPMLGWHVGAFAGDHNLHRSFLKKLEHAPSLYLALQRLVQLIRSEASHLQLGIGEREEDIVLYTHYPDMKGVPGYTSSQAYQLGVYIDIVRHYAGENWFPSEIGIEYPVVPAIVKELFPGSRILPRQRVGYIAIPRAFLHLAPRDGAVADDEIEPLVLADDIGYVDTLRLLLRPYLSDGYPSATLAASLMGTSVRTLYRRLSEASLTYRKVIDELRFSEAKELLQSTEDKITGISEAVGFDDPTHFARMFRRIGGLSPREFRKAQISSLNS